MAYNDGFVIMGGRAARPASSCSGSPTRSSRHPARRRRRPLIENMRNDHESTVCPQRAGAVVGRLCHRLRHHRRLRISATGRAAGEAAYRHADAARVDSARLPAEWWTVFNDPALNALEQRAVRDNPGVKASAQRLLQAQAQLGVFRAAQAPTVSVGAHGRPIRARSAETSQGLALGGRSIKGNNYAIGALAVVRTRSVGPRAARGRSGRCAGAGRAGRPRRRDPAAVGAGGDQLLAAARAGRRNGDPEKCAGHPRASRSSWSRRASTAGCRMSWICRARGSNGPTPKPTCTKCSASATCSNTAWRRWPACRRRRR